MEGSSAFPRLETQGDPFFFETRGDIVKLGGYIMLDMMFYIVSGWWFGTCFIFPY